MATWTREAVILFGYGGVFVLMVIEDIFVPLPSEAIMPAAGFLAERVGLSFWGVVAAGTAGSLVGGLPWYYLGRALAAGRAPDWFVRLLRSHQPAVDRAQGWFMVHGGLAVIFARLLPGVRSLIGIPAAFGGMPLTRFLAYSALGTTVWVGGLTLAGKVLGADADALARLLGATWGLAGVAVVAVLGGVVWRRHARRYAPRT